MKHLPIFMLFVLCFAISECRILNFRKQISNFGFNGHSLGSPYQENFGGKHGKHGLGRWKRHHGYGGYGYAPGPLAYLGYGGYGDFYPHHHHKGRRLRRHKHKHGRRHGFGYY